MASDVYDFSISVQPPLYTYIYHGKSNGHVNHVVRHMQCTQISVITADAMTTAKSPAMALDVYDLSIPVQPPSIYKHISWEEQWSCESNKG